MSGSADNTVRVWSLESLECLHVLERHTDAVNEVIMKVIIKCVLQCCMIPVQKDAHAFHNGTFFQTGWTYYYSL